MTDSEVSPGDRRRVRLDVAQKAFIVDGDRLLLVRKAESDPYHPGRWELPGGRLRLGVDADLEDHVRREIWEEVGIPVEPGLIFHSWLWTFPDADADGAETVQVLAAARDCRPVSTAVTTDNQTPGDHLAEAVWVHFADLQKYELIPDLKPAMEIFLSRQSVRSART